MGFEAAATSPLDFTFKPVLDVEGTIPDPTETQVRAFNAAISRITIDTRQALVDLEKEAAAENASLTAQDRQARAEEIDKRLHEQQLDAVAELCSGTPTREQLDALPFRVQVAFTEWLINELRDPTRLPATRPSLAAVR